jgi:hypothetical protein
MTSFSRLYEKQGFVLIKNLIPQKKIINVKKTFNLLSEKFLNTPYINNKQIFLHKYLSIRKSDPKKTSYLYDSLTTSYALQDLIFDRGIQLYIQALMGDKLENLSHFFRALRIDTPLENPNELDWHQDIQDIQDISDTKTSQIDGLTLWAPLTKVSSKSGTMEICKCSHFKKINNMKLLKRKKFQSKYMSISNNFASVFDKIQINANPGDVVLMNMNTLHRSIASSDLKSELRLTVIARFFKFKSKNYLPGSQRFILS